MDLSGEINAIATAALAVGVIVAGIAAYLAFRKQSQEVRAIERQVKDQEELSRQQAELLKVQSGQLEVQRQQLVDQREERRRAQARRILISAEPRPDPSTSVSVDPISTNFVTVMNTSSQPIYDLRLLFREDGEWTQPFISPDMAFLPPGERYEYPFSIDLSPFDFMLDTSLIGAIVVFRDADGVWWRRSSDGQLSEEPAPQ